MSATRRFLIVLGAPLVVIVGLSAVRGVQSASDLKAQIEEWIDAVEHSPDPVTMNLSFVPAYVDGDKVGMLRTVVIQRQNPGDVDAVDLVIEVGDRGIGELAACSFQLDPDAFDHSGPWGFKHALECIDDTEGLVPFGSVAISDADFQVTLYLDPSDVPCSSTRADLSAVCSDEIRSSLRRLREEIRTDIREALREAEIEIENAKIEVERAKAEIRTSVGN
ncbi:MAG: hypothetical protein V3T56_09780 [Gemmatimonadales bacterium]